MLKYKFNHGFCVIRCQPYHIGHDRLVKEMLKDCANVTVVIGSMQESGTDRNPLPYHVRKKMIQNVYRGSEEYNRMRIIGVKDNHNFNWAEKVLEAIKEENPTLNLPDVFYAGEQNDYEWFRDIVPTFILCSRNT